MHEVEVWRQLPILLAAPAQFAFVLVVALPWLGAGQWWMSFVTRALVIKSATLLLLIAGASIGYLVHDLDGPQDVSWSWPSDGFVCGCYWLVSAAIWYQLGSLIHERREARRKRH